MLAALAGADARASVGAATKVTLQKRVDDGPYGKSAYSFRYVTQDVAIHRNQVDLLFNGCGLLHIFSHGDGVNRVARASTTHLEDVTALPKDGWLTSCIKPERGAVYVLEIDDGITRQAVKFRVLDVSADQVKLEWEPLRATPGAGDGTMGRCGGPHEPS